MQICFQRMHLKHTSQFLCTCYVHVKATEFPMVRATLQCKTEEAAAECIVCPGRRMGLWAVRGSVAWIGSTSCRAAAAAALRFNCSCFCVIVRCPLSTTAVTQKVFAHGRNDGTVPRRDLITPSTFSFRHALTALASCLRGDHNAYSNHSAMRDCAQDYLNEVNDRRRSGELHLATQPINIGGGHRGPSAQVPLPPKSPV